LEPGVNPRIHRLEHTGPRVLDRVALDGTATRLDGEGKAFEAYAPRVPLGAIHVFTYVRARAPKFDPDLVTVLADGTRRSEPGGFPQTMPYDVHAVDGTMATSADGRLRAVTSDDGRHVIVKGARGPVAELELPPGVHGWVPLLAMDGSAVGAEVISPERRTLFVKRLPDGPLERWPIPSRAVAASADLGKVLLERAAGSWQLLDARTGKIKAIGREWGTLAISRSGRLLAATRTATGKRREEICLLDENGLVRKLSEGDADSLAFSADEKTLMAKRSGEVVLLPVDGGAARTIKLPENSVVVTFVP
jgi:hypothetical protein